MALQPGDTLLNGQYRIERKIGGGGMGVVYEAYDLNLDRRVAIKVMSASTEGDPTFLRLFQREARNAARLEHPNVAPIYHVGEHAGQPLMVMRLLPGESLHALLAREGRLPPERAIHILQQVAAALDFAHQHKVIHRDIKPRNIIVGPGDAAVLTDFGIARAADTALSAGSGQVVGTPAYMSPEQARGEPAGPASDLYALGITAFELLTGRVPFGGDNTPAVLYKHVHEPPPRVTALVPGLPRVVDAVLVRALAKEPEERYGSASEMVAALREAVTPKPPAAPVRVKVETRVGPLPNGPAQPAAASQPPPPTLQVSPEPPPKWLRPAVGGIGGLLVVVVIALIASAAGVGRGKPAPTATQPVVAQVTVTPSPTPRPLATTSAPAAATAVPPTAAPAATAPPILPSPTPAPLPTETSTPTPTAAPTVTPTPKPAFTVSQGAVNVRSGPGTVYPIVGILQQGETFEITGKNAAGDWWQFSYQGQPAWVSGQVVQAGSQAGSAGVVAAPPTPVVTPKAQHGQLIAFTFYALVTDWNNTAIHVMNTDGSSVRALTTSPGKNRSPSWSPDGKKLAFSSSRDGNDEIYVMNADGSDQRRLTDHPAADDDPAWSPDGLHLAFRSNRDGNAEIYVMDLSGANLTRLTNNPAGDYGPAWSPDGKRIAFGTDRDGNNEIYVMDADGSNLRNLTRNAASEDGAPTWSPDGSRIAYGATAYAVTAKGGTQVFVMNADGSNPVRLTGEPGTSVGASWSPDSLKIAYGHYPPGGQGGGEIYVMNADGTNPVNLTSNPAHDANYDGPAWQP